MNKFRRKRNSRKKSWMALGLSLAVLLSASMGTFASGAVYAEATDSTASTVEATAGESTLSTQGETSAGTNPSELESAQAEETQAVNAQTENEQIEDAQEDIQTEDALTDESGDEQGNESTDESADPTPSVTPEASDKKETLKTVSPKLTNTAEGILLTWSGVKGADKYKVYRMTSSGEWERLKTLTGKSYVDKESKKHNGRIYKYYVRAVKGDTKSERKVVSLKRLTAPANITGMILKGKTLRVKWKTNSKADGYEIKYSSGSKKTIYHVSKGSAYQRSIKGIKKNTTYKVKMRSYCVRDGKKVYSAWSDTIKVAPYIVVIDAGHQGHGNSGKEANGPGSSVMKTKVASGCDGYRTGTPESVVTLAVAKKLQTKLEDKGYQVVMIRTSQNVNITNKERAEIANKYPDNSIMIRLHCDSSDNHGVNGFSILTASNGNPYISKSVIQKSYTLSKDVMNAYSAGTSFRNIGIIYRDDLTATNWSKIPTTLVEMGFFSNASDETKLLSDSYQKVIADALVKGIDNYFY